MSKILRRYSFLIAVTAFLFIRTRSSETMELESPFEAWNQFIRPSA